MIRSRAGGAGGGAGERCDALSLLPWLAPRLCRRGTVLFGSVVALSVFSGLVSVSVSPVAAVLAVQAVAMASVPV